MFSKVVFGITAPYEFANFKKLDPSDNKKSPPLASWKVEIVIMIVPALRFEMPS
jgi:hypothetical protein